MSIESRMEELRKLCDIKRYKKEKIMELQQEYLRLNKEDAEIAKRREEGEKA